MARNKSDKRPGVAHQPPGGKRPRVEENPGHVEDSRPSWRLSMVDLEGPWGWSHVNREALLRIHQVLSQYESQTWGEIAGNRNNHCGPMGVDRLERNAQGRLAELGKDDVESLFKLKIDHIARVWGIRDRNILYLLWWDPEHTVYVTGKDRN